MYSHYQRNYFKLFTQSLARSLIVCLNTLNTFFFKRKQFFVFFFLQKKSVWCEEAHTEN